MRIPPYRVAPAPADCAMMDAQPHVLVVDDDARLRRLLAQFLGENGFRVTASGDAEEAWRKLRSFQFDLLIVDVMMPGESGLDFTESLRRNSGVPILMLTAMGETEDRIAGLERGADDYIAKPFEPRELLLRIQTILRRIDHGKPVDAKVRFGEWSFDRSSGRLNRGTDDVRLTDSEGRLLMALAARPGDVLSREELLANTDISGGDRAIDVQVTRLRRKIEEDPKNPRYLQTVRGKGYTLLTD